MKTLTRKLLDKHRPGLTTETVQVIWTDQKGRRHVAQVTVSEMTVADRAKFEQAMLVSGEEGTGIIREALAIACARDEAGQPLWTYDDLGTLSGYGSGFLEPIVAAAQRLNMVQDQDIAELAKNCEATDEDDS